MMAIIGVITMNLSLLLIILAISLVNSQSRTWASIPEKACGESLIKHAVHAGKDQNDITDQDLDHMATTAADAIFESIKTLATSANVAHLDQSGFLDEKYKLERQLQLQYLLQMEKLFRSQYFILRTTDKIEKLFRDKFGMLWMAATAGISPVVAVFASSVIFYLHGDYLTAVSIPSAFVASLFTYLQFYENAEINRMNQVRDLTTRFRVKFEKRLYQKITNYLISAGHDPSTPAISVPSENIIDATFRILKDEYVGQQTLGQR